MPEAGSQLYSVQEENLGKPETKPDALRAHQAIGPNGNDRLSSYHNHCALHQTYRQPPRPLDGQPELHLPHRFHPDGCDARQTDMAPLHPRDKQATAASQDR